MNPGNNPYRPISEPSVSPRVLDSAEKAEREREDRWNRQYSRGSPECRLCGRALHRGCIEVTATRMETAAQGLYCSDRCLTYRLLRTSDEMTAIRRAEERLQDARDAASEERAKSTRLEERLALATST